jgi:hypothetical protein
MLIHRANEDEEAYVKRVPSLKVDAIGQARTLGPELFLVFHLSFSVLLRYVQAQEDAERHWIPILKTVLLHGNSPQL